MSSSLVPALPWEPAELGCAAAPHLPWGHRRLGKVQLFHEALRDKQAVNKYKCIQPSEGVPSKVNRVVPVVSYSISLPLKIGTGFSCNRRFRGLPSHSPKHSHLE